MALLSTISPLCLTRYCTRGRDTCSSSSRLRTNASFLLQQVTSTVSVTFSQSVTVCNGLETRQYLHEQIRFDFCDHPMSPTSPTWQPYVSHLAALRLPPGSPTSPTWQPYVSHLAALHLPTWQPYIFPPGSPTSSHLPVLCLPTWQPYIFPPASPMSSHLAALHLPTWQPYIFPPGSPTSSHLAALTPTPLVVLP